MYSPGQDVYVYHKEGSIMLRAEVVDTVSDVRTRVRHLTRAGNWRNIKVYNERLGPAAPLGSEYLELFYESN